MACQKVFQTDFAYTKARSHDRAPSICAIFKLIAAIVRELYVSKKNNNKKKTKLPVLAVKSRNV